MSQFLITFAAAIWGALGGRERKPIGSASLTTSRAEPLTQPTEVTSEVEPGFVDLVLFISKATTEPDGSRHLWLAGFHKAQPVGFEVVLDVAWSAAASDKKIGAISFRSTGSESDAFLRALDDVYGTKIQPTNMAAAVEFTGLSLEGKPGKLAAGPVKIKCFYEPAKDNENPAEFYANIDLAKNRFELREKDEGYRACLVRAMWAQ